MDYFKRKKIFSWINLLMFLITVTIIVSIAWKKSDCDECNTYYIDWLLPSENINSIGKEINLTEKQKSEIEKVVFDIYKKNEKLILQRKDNTIKIYECIYNSSIDNAKFDSIYNNLNALNLQSYKIIKDILNEIDKIITPEQKEIQKASINDLIKYLEMQYISDVKTELEKQKQILTK